jgi:heat shock protein HslJ
VVAIWRSRLGLGAALALLCVGAAGCLGSDDDDSAPQPETLLNRTFVATSVTDDGKPRPPVPDTEIRLTFDGSEDGQTLGWRAGCNRFAADLAIGATTLEVGGVAGTEVGCPPGLAEQEAWLAEFFESDPDWELSADELTLTSGENVIVLIEEQSNANRIESVRRSPRGLGQEPPSDREVALARRIMATNAFLGRIAEDAGGYRIAQIGLINTAGPDRILGLTVDLRLDRQVDGIYELPLTCHGVAGPPFALPPTTFDLDGVSRLIVDVTFADRRIASISSLGGTSRPEPGAAYLSVPSTCERQATRDIGY